MALDGHRNSQMEVNGVSPFGSYTSNGILIIVSLSYFISFYSLPYIHLIVSIGQLFSLLF